MLYFLILSTVLIILIFLINLKILNFILPVLYSLLQIAITIYAIFNINNYDSVYFKFDNIAVLMQSMLCVVLIPVFYHSRFYLRRHIESFKLKSQFYGLIMILTTSLSTIYFSDNVVIVWVSLEVTTIAITFLINHERYIASLEAAWKYMFISSFGITIAFLGILMLSVQDHNIHGASLSFSNLQTIASNLNPLFLKSAFLLLITGYSIKINVFPLYAATIDAKTTGPFPVNALTSTVLINAGFIAIFRIYAIISQTESYEWAKHVLMITGVLSLFIATIQLFKVKRFKRLYAFSSMEHVALILIAISLGKTGIYAAFLHLVLHTFAKAGLYLHFGQIRAFYKSGWFNDTGNYLKMYGFSAITFIVGLITVTAMPPSGMFMSEILIFKSLISQDKFFVLILIAVFLIIIIYNMFRYSTQLLFGETPDNFNIEKSEKNRFEPISQLVLYGIVFYLAYFPPTYFKEIINSITNINTPIIN